MQEAREGLEAKPGTNSISTGTKLCTLRDSFRNVPKQEIVEGSNLNVFEYLQNSGGSDDVIKKASH